MVSIYAIIYNGGDVMGDLGNKEAFANLVNISKSALEGKTIKKETKVVKANSENENKND